MTNLHSIIRDTRFNSRCMRSIVFGSESINWSWKCLNLDTCAFYDRADVITIQPGALFTTEDTILYGLRSDLNVIQNCICFFFKMVRMWAWMLQQTESSEITSAGVISRERLTFHRFPLNDPERLRLCSRFNGIPVYPFSLSKFWGCAVNISHDTISNQTREMYNDISNQQLCCF